MDAAAQLRQHFAQDAELLGDANKQDLPGCVELALIKETLHIDGVTKNPHGIKAIAVVGERRYVRAT